MFDDHWIINCRSQISAGKSTIKTLYFWSSKNISKKTDVPILSEDGASQKERLRWARRGPHHRWARVPPWPRPGMVWAPRGSPAAALSPTYSSRENNPKGPSHYPRKVSETPPPSTLAREGSEPLPGTLPERGIVTGGFYIAMPASGVMRE